MKGMHLLNALKDSPRFSDFIKIGDCVYTDKAGDDSTEQLSIAGYKNHKTGEIKTLEQLVDELGVIVSGEQIIKPSTLSATYENTSNTSQDIISIKRYFLSNKIFITERIIEDIGMKVLTADDGSLRFIVPLMGVNADIIQLYIIKIDSKLRKVSEDVIGVGREDRAIVFGTFKKEELVIFRDIEDGIAYFIQVGVGTIMVTGNNDNYKNISSMINEYDSVIAILNNEMNNQNAIKSLPLGDAISRKMPLTGLSCAGAVERGKFDEWNKELESIEIGKIQLLEKKICRQVERIAINNILASENFAKQRANGEAMTDIGNAERFVKLYSPVVRYCNRLNEWYIWDKTHWKLDAIDQVTAFAKATVRSIYKEAQDSIIKESLIKHATKSESISRIWALKSLAKSDSKLAVDSVRLDSNPDVINFLNGTFDFNTGKLKKHDKKDFLTNIVNYNYDKDAKAPYWERFLKDITDGDSELVSFLQRAVGYSLNGRILDHAYFFLYGDGLNGKSTFLETIQTIFGQYSAKIASERLSVQKFGSGIPNDIAHLKNARIAFSSEVGDSLDLDETKIKDMTGGDILSARKLHQQLFDFKPQFTLWLYGNYKPVIKGLNFGIWRRTFLVPFQIQIKKPDRYLPIKLERESEGIIAWAIEGYRQYAKDGLNAPGIVTTATNSYRSEMDSVQQFLNDHCIEKHTKSLPLKHLYECYSRWCEETGSHALNRKFFLKTLSSKGHNKRKSTSGEFKNTLVISQLQWKEGFTYPDPSEIDQATLN